MAEYELYHGDCLEVMKGIVDNSIDMILVDLPYQMTRSEWDTIVPLAPMWRHVKRVLREGRASVMFGSQPFTSMLISSNYKWFRHEWVWEKNQPTNALNSRVSPMKAHENILVFGDGAVMYNPQITNGHCRKVATKKRQVRGVYGETNQSHYDSTDRYPRSVLRFKTVSNFSYLHPNQKPVPLLEYLVRTYTHEGDTVLDFTMGSASTGVACGRLNRHFIGIEQDAEYFRIAEQRVKNAYGEFVLTDKEKKTGQMSLFAESIDNTP